LFESGDFLALSHDGELLWRRDLAKDYGKFEGNHGQGSSPVLTASGVVVVMDHKGPSFIASLDKASGKTLWKTDRKSSSAWSTPVSVERQGKPELIVSASGTVIGYDPITGHARWVHAGIDGNNVPSPSVASGLAVIAANKKNQSLALRVDHTDTAAVAWVADEVASAFGSPLIHQGRVYFVNDAGVAYCYRLENGQLLWSERVADSTWASPLGASERIYFFGKNGQTTIASATDRFEVLHEGSMEVGANDRVYGYAVVDGTLVFRSGSQLVCVRSAK